jgi:hypothetical protein
MWIKNILKIGRKKKTERDILSFIMTILLKMIITISLKAQIVDAIVSQLVQTLIYQFIFLENKKLKNNFKLKDRKRNGNFPVFRFFCCFFFLLCLYCS